MLQGMMARTDFDVLPEEAKIGAWLGGKAADLPTDFKGETAEEATKYVVEQMGLQGFDALRELLRRLPIAKLGIKVGSIAVSTAIVNGMSKLASLDPVTKAKFDLYVPKVLQGIIDAMVDASDPERGNRAIDKAIYMAEYTDADNMVNPGAVQVVLMIDPGTGMKSVHPAVKEGGGYKTLTDADGKDLKVPATGCKHCEGKYILHMGAYRKETTQPGNKNGQKGGGGSKTTEPPAFREAELILLEDALKITDLLFCPTYWPSGKPAAVVAKSWKDQVGVEGIELLDAMLLYPRTTADKIDDITGVDFAEEAANVPVDEWAQLAQDIKSGKGIYDGCWQAAVTADLTVSPPVEAKAEGLTKTGFGLVLDKICARGKGKLKPENVVKKATFATWEQTKTAWKKNKRAAFGILATAGGLALVYALAGVLVVWSYYEGMTGSNLECLGSGDDLTAFEQVTTLFLASLASLVWFVSWYSSERIKVFSFGLLGEGLADTARNTTALLCGFASVLIVMKVLNGFFTGGMTGVQAFVSMPFAAVLAVIAYNRIAAKWHAEDSVHNLEVWLAENNIRALSTMGGLVFVLMALIGWMAWFDSDTTFRVAVEAASVDGTEVRYIPSPKGGAFRPEDILGRTVAETVQKGEVCVPKGTQIDLPGYSEKEVTGGCPVGMVAYAVRERVFGRFLDDGVVEYETIEALYLASYREEAELAEVVKATLAPSKAEETVSEPPSPPKAKVSAVAPASASAQPKAKRADCSKLSPVQRRKQGC